MWALWGAVREAFNVSNGFLWMRCPTIWPGGVEMGTKVTASARGARAALESARGGGGRGSGSREENRGPAAGGGGRGGSGAESVGTTASEPERAKHPNVHVNGYGAFASHTLVPPSGENKRLGNGGGRARGRWSVVGGTHSARCSLLAARCSLLAARWSVVSSVSVVKRIRTHTCTQCGQWSVVSSVVSGHTHAHTVVGGRWSVVSGQWYM